MEFMDFISINPSFVWICFGYGYAQQLANGSGMDLKL